MTTALKPMISFAACLAVLVALCSTPLTSDAQTSKAPGAKQAPKATPPEDKQSPTLRLFERTPCDLIVLKNQADGGFEVELLDLPDRKLPVDPKPNDKLVIRLVRDPTGEYEIHWRDVAEVRLFEQRLLAEAQSLVTKEEFDEAYDYFGFLQRNYAGLAGLEEAVQHFLYEEAKAWQRREQYAQALSLLEALAERNPAFAGLDAALGAATGKLVEQYAARQDYHSTARLLANLAARFPQQATLHTWEERLAQEAMGIVVKAKERLAAGRLHESYELAESALRIWPKLSAGREFFDELHVRYRSVAVGVMALRDQPPQGSCASIVDWAQRRSEPLLNQTLLEFGEPGPEGGRYQSPLGDCEATDLGQGLLFRLRAGLHTKQGEPLTSSDVARRLAAQTLRDRPEYWAEWAELCSAIEVRDIQEVQVTFRRAHPHPEAMLSSIIIGPTAGRSLYDLTERKPDENVYLAQLSGAAGVGQIQRVVERKYASSDRLLADLKNETIAAVDRVPPSDVAAFKAAEKVTVERYCVPTVHCLWPNPTRPLTRSRTFRRALEYGIHRGLILDQHILKGRPLAGCRQVSGPFPPGVGIGDTIGYGYDERVKPRPYDPRLAITLATVALQEAAAEARTRGETLEAMPTLALSHPPGPIAPVACRAIQRHLETVGIPVVLKEMPSTLALAPGSEVDLAYLELSWQEPLVEAGRVFGPSGPLGEPGASLRLALTSVAEADTWREVSDRLHRLHRLIHEEATLIPLWQMSEHLAYHQHLQGVGAKPASLYAHVEAWRRK